MPCLLPGLLPSVPCLFRPLFPLCHVCCAPIDPEWLLFSACFQWSNLKSVIQQYYDSKAIFFGWMRERIFEEMCDKSFVKCHQFVSQWSPITSRWVLSSAKDRESFLSAAHFVSFWFLSVLPFYSAQENCIIWNSRTKVWGQYLEQNSIIWRHTVEMICVCYRRISKHLCNH